MGGFISELMTGLRRLVLGLLAVAGLAAVLGVAGLAWKGALTRERLEAAAEALRRPPAPPAAPAAPETPAEAPDVALTRVRTRTEAERADLVDLRESLWRTELDLKLEREALDREQKLLDDLRRQQEGVVQGVQAVDQEKKAVQDKRSLIDYQKSRPEMQALLQGGAAAAAGPSTGGAPPDAAGAVSAGPRTDAEAFAQASRVLAKTDPRAAAQRLLSWTATEPPGPGRETARVVPDYAEMVRWLRGQRDAHAAEILEEMARLKGPGDEPDYGTRVAAELHQRLGRLRPEAEPRAARFGAAP